MPRRASHTQRLSLVFFSFAIILAAASPAFANAGTPLMWASAMYLMFGNAIIGIVEGLLIGKLFKVRFRRAVLIMILANYVSMFSGVAGVEYLSRWFQDVRMRQDPLQAGWQATVLAAIASYLCSVILEWPFCIWAMRKTGARAARSLGASLVAQTASYCLLVPYFSSCSQMTLYTEASLESDLGFVKPPIATVYYINPDDGDVWRIRTDGTGKQRVLSEDITSRRSRLFADMDEQSGRYFLWNDLGVEDIPKKLVNDIGSLAAPRMSFKTLDEPGAIKDRGWWRTSSTQLTLDPESPLKWRTRPGTWAAEGIGVSKEEKWEYSIAMDAPFVAWFCRNAVNLPNDQAIFQMDDMIVILDMPTKKLAFLTIGRGPVVAIEDAPTTQPDANLLDSTSEY